MNYLWLIAFVPLAVVVYLGIKAAADKLHHEGTWYADEDYKE